MNKIFLFKWKQNIKGINVWNKINQWTNYIELYSQCIMIKNLFKIFYIIKIYIINSCESIF